MSTKSISAGIESAARLLISACAKARGEIKKAIKKTKTVIERQRLSSKSHLKKSLQSVIADKFQLLSN
jgi:hypothetical protein